MEFSVEGLACRRGELRVLEGVGFTLTPGEAVILRGPNGAGKTTLLRCLAGLTPPLEGEMSFSHDDVAYAGHLDGLKAQLTGAENLRFWAAIYGSDQIDTAVAQFDLEGLLDRQAQHMSAGQKRRLALARLMLTGRKIWALDEPTVSLDTQNVARFARCIESHLSTGGSAIIATHIDLGLPNARVLDVGPFKASAASDQFDPFLEDMI